MKIKEYEISEFIEKLAGSDPVPGGGSAAGLCGAVGASLAAMVGSLTSGKKKFAEIEDDVKANLAEAKSLSEKLMAAGDKDMEVFLPLSKAYGMPESTEEEKIEKGKVMEEALYQACLAPLEIMELNARAIEICEYFAESGSRLAISDAGSGAIISKAALQAASLNVFINTGSMKNREVASELNDKAEALLKDYTIKADEVYSKVYAHVRKWWAD